MNAIHLVKKDFLLGKKHVLFMMLFVAAVPFFIIWRVPMLNGLISFMFGAVFTELMICQSISMAESKFPKASALICAAPYSRRSVVIAKYVFFLMIFAICLIVYGIVAMAVPQISTISVIEALAALTICSVFHNIYMPCQFKFGFEKTKYAFMVMIFGFSFGVPLLYNTGIQIDLSAFTAMSFPVQCALLVLFNAVILVISAMVSIAIFKKKEL